MLLSTSEAAGMTQVCTAEATLHCGLQPLHGWYQHQWSKDLPRLRGKAIKEVLEEDLLQPTRHGLAECVRTVSTQHRCCWMQKSPRFPCYGGWEFVHTRWCPCCDRASFLGAPVGAPSWKARARLCVMHWSVEGHQKPKLLLVHWLSWRHPPEVLPSNDPQEATWISCEWQFVNATILLDWQLLFVHFTNST